MKKLLLILLLLVNAIVFGQITSLISDCSGTTFNLNSKIPELITNQNPNNTTITFHLTFFDAVSLTNPIANTSAFAGTNGQEIWANVLNNTTGLSSQPSFSLAVTSSNLAVTTSIISPVTCAMGGTIQAIASGGSGNYTYILAPLSVSNSSGIFSGLSPGTYTIYVSEINSCSATSQVVMIAPLSIIAITTIENFLTNSTITITATGGSGPYTYSLDGVIFQSSNVFFVSPGSYVYRVKDSLGCIYTGTVNVANSALPTLSISNGSTIEGNPLIFLIGLSNVSTVDTVINLITSNDSATLNDYTPTTTTITIPAGQTTVSFNIQTQTDNIACEPNETFTLIGTVTSGNTLNSSSSGIGTISDISISNLQSSISFSGNIAILNVTGGFPNYIYSMNGGAFQASNVFTTAYGSFNYFTIEDDNGCSFLVNATTPVAPCNFDFIIYSSQDIPTSTFYLNLTGTFSGNFSYTIDGTQAVLINNLNATILANSLQYGNHYVTVTDSMSGCSITETFIGGTAQLNNISISMTGAYNDYNNDGFTNVGDVVNYQFTVNNPNNVAIDNVNISNQQLIMSGSPITSLAAMSSDSTTFTGTYVITQQDINSGTVFGSAVVTGSVNGQQIINDAGIQTNLNISRGFKLNAFFDTNGNGIQDGVETNFSGGNFTYQLAGATAQNIYSNNGVFYLYENNPNNAYNLSYNLPNYNNFCGNGYVVTTSSYSNVTLSGTGITTYNFAITQGSCTDLSVYLYSVGGPRPGFVNSNYIYFTNNGNATISSGTITFTNDNALSVKFHYIIDGILSPSGFSLKA